MSGQSRFVRLIPLAFSLLAFARLTWALGENGLWWDESLSLQRAEQAWIPLLLGHLTLYDGLHALRTIDQHPFFYFLLQGLFLRVAGESEFALRFVSVMAATLLVPALWALSRALVLRGGLPSATPAFAAMLASISPFFLWYGQEARPYALWGLLAIVGGYALVRVAMPPAGVDHAQPGKLQQVQPRRVEIIAYGGTLLAFVATHYYAVFHLPLHAWAWLMRLGGHRRTAAWLGAGGLLLGGGLFLGAIYYRIIYLQGGGGNFSAVNLRILVPDLLNAFSLGLSVNIDRVWWLVLVYAGVAAIGLAWMVWRPARLMQAGWLPVGMILSPVVAILAINWFMPAYMTARHMSLIGGGYLMLIAAGLAVLWNIHRALGLPVAALLIAGALYSTHNYFTQEEYTHHDLAGVASHLSGRLAEGDLVLLKPPFSWRIFDYYLPLEKLAAAESSGAHIRRLGVPLLVDDWNARDRVLAELTPDYRRIWLVVLGTHPFLDLEERTEAWLDEHLFRVQHRAFFAQAQLSVTLYVPEVPVTWDAPAIHHAYGVTFGDQIHLAGYDMGHTLYDDLALPITLYWQTLHDTDRHYKYLLRLVRVAEDFAQLSEPDSPGESIQIAPEAVPIEQVISITEREPFDGAIPTIFWAPGQTIIEPAELPPGDWAALRAAPEQFRLTLEVYDGETLEKLPVTHTAHPSDYPAEHSGEYPSAGTPPIHTAGDFVLLPVFVASP